MDTNFLRKNREDTLEFLDSIQDIENKYKHFPTSSGLTKSGKLIELGYSCFALKTYYILGEWDKFDQNYQNGWINYINSFQTTQSYFPNNSFIDQNYLNSFYESKNKKIIKDTLKPILGKGKFESKKSEALRHVRSESKQAIASLAQVGHSSKKSYENFPQTEEDITNFLNSLDWRFPWQAGAQFASLCVFIKTQLSDNSSQTRLSIFLNKYIEKLLDSETGGYFIGKQTKNNQVINGAMKVITGLSWLECEVHLPEKLIDYCLGSKPSSEGCDLVDIVYVLHSSMNNSSYRKKDVVEYLNVLLEIIKKHKFQNSGYSYYINQSQIYYYGLKITKGLNVPDLHGTTLLNWAISMIAEINELSSERYKVLKA
jgi:hypothetical protein